MIRAVPTSFSGVLFRSKLESRWASLLTNLGVRWEYEKQKFNTSYGWYLPDFWLPDLSMWAEVKPYAMSAKELVKIQDVSAQTGQDSLLLLGAPRPEVTRITHCGDMQALHHYRGLVSVPFTLGE